MSAPQTSLAPDCFHCGLPIPSGIRLTVDVENITRELCCAGCQAVAQAIVDNGLSSYYHTRDGFPAASGRETLVPEELSLYDQDEVLASISEASNDAEGVRQASFSIEGLRCGACVWLIEKRLLQVPGIRRAHINMSSEALHVRWDETLCKPSDILRAVRELGYLAYPFDVERHGEHLRKSSKALFRKVFVAGLAMMQVMMYAYPAYVSNDGTFDADMAALMSWASLVLTIPVVFYSAIPFFQGAWRNLKNRSLGMDVPVALGVTAAFTGSLHATLTGVGEVYYDSVTMFVFLLLCSRYLELNARTRAAATLEKMKHALPPSASRMAGFPQQRETETVPAALLKLDDIILIKPGEAIPADCVVIEGNTSIDASLLTGESRPQHCGVGVALPGGAIVISQPIVARVTRTVRESTMAALLNLISKAGDSKPRISEWADHAAAQFVAALLSFSIVVFFVWQWVQPERAWEIAIAVLVVSCPCALSMATPTALAAATDRLVRGGVLVVRSHVLETLSRITHVIFDKTGTLTYGKPVLRRARVLGSADEKTCLQIAAAMEASSAHPLAMAIRDAAEAAGGGDVTVTSLVHTSGRGLEAVVDGQTYRLGSREFVQELTQALPDVEAPAQHTPVYFGKHGAWLACFELADVLRADAQQVVDHFRDQGKKVILLSGDQDSVARHVAAELGIQEAHGQQLPHQKLAYVEALQRQGAIVAMVGDGINDAAVLRAANVSFAMGQGAALAHTSADAVLLQDRLNLVTSASHVAQQAIRIVRQNLGWATLYNVTAIPAAAFGLLTPWMASVGMALSSAIVVVNALRLRRARMNALTTAQQSAVSLITKEAH